MSELEAHDLRDHKVSHAAAERMRAFLRQAWGGFHISDNDLRLFCTAIRGEPCEGAPKEEP